MQQGIERRQYPRVSLSHVTVEVYSSEGKPYKPEFCFVINVSECGMLFKAETPTPEYTPGTVVRLTFVLPDNGVMIRTDASIIHMRSTDLSQYVGVQYKDMALAEKGVLREFVNVSLKSGTP
jgi:hypothetical protein